MNPAFSRRLRTVRAHAVTLPMMHFRSDQSNSYSTISKYHSGHNWIVPCCCSLRANWFPSWSQRIFCHVAIQYSINLLFIGHSQLEKRSCGLKDFLFRATMTSRCSWDKVPPGISAELEDSPRIEVKAWKQNLSLWLRDRLSGVCWFWELISCRDLSGSFTMLMHPKHHS